MYSNVATRQQLTGCTEHYHETMSCWHVTAATTLYRGLLISQTDRPTDGPIDRLTEHLATSHIRASPLICMEYSYRAYVSANNVTTGKEVLSLIPG